MKTHVCARPPVRQLLVAIPCLQQIRMPSAGGCLAPPTNPRRHRFGQHSGRLQTHAVAMVLRRGLVARPECDPSGSVGNTHEECNTVNRSPDEVTGVPHYRYDEHEDDAPSALAVESNQGARNREAQGCHEGCKKGGSELTSPLWTMRLTAPSSGGDRDGPSGRRNPKFGSSTSCFGSYRCSPVTKAPSSGVHLDRDWAKMSAFRTTCGGDSK